MVYGDLPVTQSIPSQRSRKPCCSRIAGRRETGGVHSHELLHERNHNPYNLVQRCFFAAAAGFFEAAGFLIPSPVAVCIAVDRTLTRCTQLKY